MVFKINCQSGISLPTSGSLLPSQNPKTSTALARQRNRASIRADLSVSSNCLRSRKELQLNWAANFNRVGLTCEFRKRIEGRRAGPFGPQLPIRVSSMSVAVGSASVYPVKGIFYFLRGENRLYLWRRVAVFAAEVGAASVAIFGSLVGFTFSAQRGLLLQVVPHFFGTPGTIALILVETAIPVALLFYNRLNRIQDKLFDDVLRLENVEVGRSSAEEREWIDEQREIQRRHRSEEGSPSLFRSIADPTAMNEHPIMKYFITLPLNFVPVAGTAAFCWLNAMDVSTMLHHHYYSKLKGLSAEEEATIVYCRRKQYQQFGLMATCLTLLPGFDVILVLTNAVGAALWAVDIERDLQRRR